jgi:hypothetical protein
MNALVSPNEAVQTYTWVSDGKGGWVTQWADIPNAERIAEVSATPFEVAPPLFWVSCADNVVADQWYYDSATQQCVQIVYPPKPAPTPQSGPNVVA